MSKKLNQHFVPQFHFRLFSDGMRYIHLASREGSRLVKFAGIRGQCARHKFYGDKQTEDWLEKLEARLAPAYRATIEVARGSRTPLSDEEKGLLREAILLQRSRTPRHARIHASASDQMTLYAFAGYLKALPATAERDAMMSALEQGRATLRDSDLFHLLLSLRIAMRSAIGISDLSILILRNESGTPFVLGDAPCVFSNHYMRGIRNHGVLGYVTPGLTAVLPIDSWTQVLLFDPAVYRPDYSTDGCIVVYELADISLLNALQVHAATANIYFSDVSSESYVLRLLAAHRSTLQDHQGRFVVNRPGQVLINGIPNPSEVLQIFESQLPITLDLSFLKTAVMPRHENPNRPRNPELAKQLKLVHGAPDDASGVSMENFAQWVESQIEVRL